MLRALVDDIVNVLDMLEDALYETAEKMFIIFENTRHKALGDKCISFTRREKLSEEYQEKTLIGKTG